MRRTLLLLLVSVSLVYSSCATCDDEVLEKIDKDRRAEAAIHECRSCTTIPLNAAANCPVLGYDCDLNLVVTSNVLSTDECACAQLQCRDANATLAVGGAVVHKVRCEAVKWVTPSATSAASAVCARNCDLGVCAVLPHDYFDGQDIFGPLVVFPPDAQHPCAWADCQIGAVAKKDTTDLVYRGISSFACSGDRTWRYTGPRAEERHLYDVACIIKDCESLPFGSTSNICRLQYMCYAPDFVEGDGDDWKKMTCPEARALRLSEENKESSLTCKIGQWSADSSKIEDTTKVVCVTCPGVTKEPSDIFQPTASAMNKAVTCENGRLTVEYGGATLTAVTSLTCSAEFFWTATGGDFTPFSSLEDAVSKDVSWKARCTQCDTLPYGSTSQICQSKYLCYAPDFVDGDGDIWKKMTCPEARALRLSEENKEASPTCKVGQWSVDATIIDDATKVVCVTCPNVAKEPLDAVQPTVSDKNKAVTCASGRLTVEYELGGTHQTAVTTLTCSDEFAWTTTGGDFTPSPSLEAAVNQGATWKARCLKCDTLPFGSASDICQSKYVCYAPNFVDGDGAYWKKMTCPEIGTLRLSETNTIATPTCEFGQWSANANNIAVTTEVVCVTCPAVNKEPTDTYQPTVSNMNKQVTCANGQLTVEYAGASQTAVTSLTCSSDFAWSTVGGDFTPFPSIEDIVNRGIGWKARCLVPCLTCSPALIALGPGPPTVGDSTSVVNGCNVRTLTCTAAPAPVALTWNSVNTISNGLSTEMIVATCNAAGTAWEYQNQAVTQLSCAVPCQACSPALITLGPGPPTVVDSTTVVNGCNVRTLTCTAAPAPVALTWNSVNTISNGLSTEMIVATCNAAGTAWEYQSQAVTQLSCAVPCQTCSPALITLTPSNPTVGDSTAVVNGCNVRTFTCSAAPAPVALTWNSVNTISNGISTEMIVATCNAAGTAWEYMGTAVTSAICRVPCRTCSPALITLGSGPPTVGDSSAVVNGCQVRTLTCTAASSVALTWNSVNTISNGAPTEMISATCNAAGTAWEYMGTAVTQLSCAVPCQSCSPALITLSPGPPVPGDSTAVVSGCSERTLTCSAVPVVELEWNSANTINDGGTGMASLIATCNAAGTAWMYQGQAVTSAKCCACQSCPQVPSGAITAEPPYWLITDTVVNGCSVRSYTVISQPVDFLQHAFIRYNTKTVDNNSNTATLVATCNCEGTAWMYMGEALTFVGLVRW